MRMVRCLVAMVVLLDVSWALAQPYPVPDTWGGDVLSRPRLTGDWGGWRDEMAKKGVVLDVDMLVMPQGVASGGTETDPAMWNHAEYTLNLDTQKAGLWPGGFVKVVGLTAFGSNIFRDSGALVPVNTALILPSTDPTSGLMNATFTQFLSPHFGLTAGKLYLVDGVHGEFMGNYRTQFLNTGLTFPMAAALVPLSAYGGGVIGLPSDDLLLTMMVVDPNGTPTDSDLGDVFDSGVTLLPSAALTIRPFDLVGNQKLTFMWSNKERLSLNQSPANLGELLLEKQFPRLGDPGPGLEALLEATFPGATPPTPVNTESSTWGLFYSFEQYLWQPDGDAKRGVGVFFVFGAADGNPNPIQYSYAMGVGGNGVMASRPHDNFGVGWARTEFSGSFLPFLREQLDIGLGREDAVELYYNAAITGWLQATLDLQIVDPALKKTFNSSTRQLDDVDTTVIPGLRLYARF